MGETRETRRLPDAAGRRAPGGLVTRLDLKFLLADTGGGAMVIYAVAAGLVSMGALSAFGSYDGEVADVLLTASDTARAFLDGGR